MVKQVKDIEELLRWTYQDQRADVVLEQAAVYDLGRASISPTGVLMKRLEFDLMQFDNTMNKGYALHPDAEKLHDLVCSLPALELGLIVTHAKTASRPDLLSEAETLELIGEDPYGATELIGFERETYKIWWSALDKLVCNINELSSFVVSGPAVHCSPWTKK